MAGNENFRTLVKISHKGLLISYKPIGASPGRGYEDGIISTYYILWSRQYIILKKGGEGSAGYGLIERF